MSFFRREPDRPQPPESSRSSHAQTPRPAAPSRVTLVAEGTKVTGEISGDTEVRVDGEVDGDLAVGARVVVGGSGVVRGSIQARNVEVGGKVYGNIHGSDRVEVTSSGSLEGDISAPRVTIAEGAFFKGKVEMTGSPERRPASKPARPAPQTPQAPKAPRAESDGDEKGAAS